MVSPRSGRARRRAGPLIPVWFLVALMVALTGCQPRTLWSWGANSVGQLGIGTTTPIPVAEYKHLRDLASSAGDLWNELDRRRSYWEDWDVFEDGRGVH